MTISAFYVLISRVREGASLRLLQCDEAGLASVGTLRPDEFLAAWERGYDAQGRWSDALAKAALEGVRGERKRAQEVAAKAKAEARQQAGRERARQRKQTEAARRAALR